MASPRKPAAPPPPTPPPPPPPPLPPQPSARRASPAIPLAWIDAPTQRVYAVSAVAALQAYKVYKFISYTSLHGAGVPAPALFPSLASPSSPSAAVIAALIHPLFLPALLIDVVLVAALWRLSIPRLDFRGSAWVALLLASVLLDWTLLGGWRVLGRIVTLVPVVGSLFTTAGSFWSDFFSQQISISEHRVRVRDLVQPRRHIFGQHTIHILPHSTAWFLPSSGVAAASCYCIGPHQPRVTVPVVFNNTDAALLQYSITPFDVAATDAEAQLFNVTIPRGVAASARQAEEGLLQRLRGDQDELDLELRDLDSGSQLISQSGGTKGGGGGIGSGDASQRRLAEASSRHVFQLPISHTGRIRLERVLDRKNLDAQISRSEILVVECPSAGFAPRSSAAGEARAPTQIGRSRAGDRAGDATTQHFCPGDEGSLDVVVRGLAPLEISYSQRLKSAARAKQPPQIRTVSHISSPYVSSPLVGGGVGGSSSSEAGAASSAERLSLALAASSRAAVRSRDGEATDFGWAQARDVHIPLSLSLERPGVFEYALWSVRDACGHKLSLRSADDDDDQVKAANAKSGGGKRKIQSAPSSADALVSTHHVVVHPRPQVQFEGCSEERPLQQIRGGPKLGLSIRAHAEGVPDQTEAGWFATLRFDPATVDGLPPDSASRVARFNVSLDATGRGRVEALGPGTYTLEGAHGTYCSGEVGAPWTCPVVDVPPPEATITFSSIQDACVGPVGVKALAVLSGTPPFRLGYTEKRGSLAPRRLEKLIHSNREEIEFRPNSEGEVLYRFERLSDANYRDVALEGPEFRQVLHPVASARFVAAGGVAPSSDGGSRLAVEIPPSQRTSERVVVYGCEATHVSADVELTGVGPFELTYALRSGSGGGGGGGRGEGQGGATPAPGRPGKKGAEVASRAAEGGVQTLTVRDVREARHRIDVELPKPLVERGGELGVSLVSIRDAKGCERALTSADLVVEVRRTHPTAAFVVPTDRAVGEVHVLQDEAAKLPLRLAGEAPWALMYTFTPDAVAGAEGTATGGEERRVSLRSADAELDVPAEAGTYRLSSVRDAHCPGAIIEDGQSFHVSVRPRPSIRFDDAGERSPRNASLLRRAVCAGTPDSVDLRVSGSFPVHVEYDVAAPVWRPSHRRPMLLDDDEVGEAGAVAGGGGAAALALANGQFDNGGTMRARREAFTSALNVTTLRLATSTPGWHVYRLRQLGDSLYPTSELPGPRTAAGRGGAVGGGVGAAVDPVYVVEQMVYPLPWATLKPAATSASFCVGDVLAPSAGGVPSLQLHGAAPFSIDFEVRELFDQSGGGGRGETAEVARRAGAGAASPPGSYRVLRRFHADGVPASGFNLTSATDGFRFPRMGRYAVAVTRLEDAHGCSLDVESLVSPSSSSPSSSSVSPAQATAAMTATTVRGLDALVRQASATVDVAETASIAAVGTREDFCIGETIDFVLQGTPPWTVEYTFNGRTSRVQTREARFSRVTGHEAGTLVVRSVAHQQNKCRSEVAHLAGMTRRIHELPTVRVSAGRYVVEDLREGNQAQIDFSLSGEPPFSFTYQRTEPVDRRASPKVLETHTVSAFMEDTYTITTSQEGTWSVTWLQDRWCSVSLDTRSGEVRPLGKARLGVTQGGRGGG